MKKELDELDYELIEKAKEVIIKNYDPINFNHTVGVALRTKDNKIYVGINVYSVHGACAELIALGNALTNLEREFKTIVAINGENLEIMSPCGNCRQLLTDYAPNIDVIVEENSNKFKINIKELIPYAYHAKY